ncbi:MAG: hypothetical protein LBQ34_00820 [Alphaproteobacteria bacterium]|jgi:lipopolysaccharide biosynthesis glycosyltransferase|nr:hypothetical protein [Alphaproteobacteria bacterium]
MKYNIAFAINKNHLLFAFITIHSLLQHNQENFFDIYLQHNNCLTQQDIDIFLSSPPLENFSNFKIHLLDCSTIEELKDIKNHAIWPKEIYFKLFLPNLLPNIDKILFLDTDTLIIENIKQFLDTDLKNNIICGDSPYNNTDVVAGVSLINLALARENKFTEKSITFIKNSYGTDRVAHEEAAINTIFYGKIIFANNIATLISKSTTKKNFNIVHFVRVKPWKFNRIVVNSNIRKLYLAYLANLKLFAKNKTNRVLLVSLYLFLLYGGFNITSAFTRLRNTYYKHILKLPKYEYVHKDFITSFIKNSTLGSSKKS